MKLPLLQVARGLRSNFLLGLRPRPAALHRSGRSPARTCAGTFFEFLAHPSAFILGCALAVGAAHGQEYPAKPVRVVVAFAAGGFARGGARPVRQKLSPRLGPPR